MSIKKIVVAAVAVVGGLYALGTIYEVRDYIAKRDQEFDDLLDMAILMASTSTHELAPKILDELQFVKIAKTTIQEENSNGQDD